MTKDNVENLIRKMNDNKRYDGNPTTQFFCFWVGLNAWLAYCTGESSDRKMIELLANKNQKTSDLFKAYDSAFSDKQKIFKHAIKELAGKTKENASIIQLFNIKKKVWEPVIIKDENDFAGIVRAIYGIRCGLFHGKMDINDGENSARVNLAGRILDTWIEYLIRGWMRNPTKQRV